MVLQTFSDTYNVMLSHYYIVIYVETQDVVMVSYKSTKGMYWLAIMRLGLFCFFPLYSRLKVYFLSQHDDKTKKTVQQCDIIVFCKNVR